MSKTGTFILPGSIDGLVYSLWSLLPSFCNYPLDTAETFKDLEISLCHFLQEEPDLRGVICTSLQFLIRQNKKVIEGENEPPSGKELGICEQRAFLRYTSEVAVCNLDVLRSSAREILSTLLGVFVKSSNDDGGSLKRTIGEFASVADKGVVFQFFRSIVVKLLKATQEARKVQNNKGSSSMEVDSSSNETSLSQMRAQALDLAISLLPGLGTTEVDALFEFLIRPALKVERMVAEAEKYAKEDKEKRDAIDTKNQAESAVYRCEKQLKKVGEKVPSEVKEKVESKLKELKDAISGGSTQTIKDAMSALNQEMMQLGQSIYSQAGGAAAAGGGGTGDAPKASGSSSV